MSAPNDKRSPSGEKDWISRKTLRPKETLRMAKEHLMKGQYAEAMPLLQRIEDYVIEAAFVLGVMHFEGIYVKPNKVVDINPSGQRYTVWAPDPGDCVCRDLYDRQMRSYRGHPVVWVLDVSEHADLARGINYMKKIAKISTLLPEEELFVRQAQLNLGNLYYRGAEVPKSDEDAERYWLMAASGKKNPDTGRLHPPTVEAQTALGKFYSLGKTRNIEKALYWHSRAYSNGSFASEASLGMMLMSGIGVPENPVKACLHLVNASLKGSIVAYGLLTAMFYKRQMYYKVVEIGKWLTKIEDMEMYAEHCSCPLGDVRSSIALGSFYLGLCYQYGYAVKKDLSIAKQLIKRALDLRPKLGRKLHIRAIIGDL